MKRCLPALLLAAVCGATLPARAAPPPGFDWVQTLHEGCQGTALDPRIWRLASDPGWGPKILSNRVPENVVLKGDGVCRLVYRLAPSRGKEWTTGGMISTGFQQAYGYFEVRMKYAPAMGGHQSFWLSRQSKTDPAGNFEIDINEGHYPRWVAANLHQPTQAGVPAAPGKSFNASVDLSADFHTYGLLWLPDPKVGARLTWFLDGRPFHEMDCRNCTVPAPVLLTGAVVSWARPTPALDGLETQVTDLRIYQLRELLPPPAAGTSTPR
jgi:beta-glucanase (GH16 family)